MAGDARAAERAAPATQISGDEPPRRVAKYDGIRGQELLEVEERDNELILIFRDNRFLFVRVENGKLVTESVPERGARRARPRPPSAGPRAPRRAPASA